MIIKKIELYRYKRFFLSNINKLIYAPNSNIQFIIAKNGSGKSSLLSQLNPLPTDSKKDFYEDGYKLIEIEHNNNLYKLTSGYSNKSYSFIVNNVELNECNGKKVQLELIKEHFNITPSIIEVLLNINKFTNMPPSDRKYWISEISTVDYSYPIKIYNNLKSKHRDIVGGIKLLTEEITKLTNNILTEEELNKLLDDKETLSNYYQHVISLYDHTIKSKDNDDKKYLTSSNELHTFKTLFTKLSKGKSKTELEEELNKINNNLNIVTSKLADVSKLLTRVEELSKIDDKSKLIEELDIINNNISNIANTLKYDKDIYKLEYYITDYLSACNIIISNLNELKEYENMRLGKNINTCKDKLILLENKIKTIVNKKQILEHDIKRIEELTLNDKTICPKCSHTWIYGYDINKLNKYKEELIDTNNLLNKATNIHKIKVEEVNKLNKAQDIINNIKLLISTKQDLKFLWVQVLKDIDFNKDSIGYILNIFNNHIVLVSNCTNINKLLKTRDKLLNDLKVIEEINKQNLELKLDKIKEYEEELNILTLYKNNLYKDKNNIEELLLQHTKLFKVRSKVSELISNNYKKYRQEYKLLRNNYITIVANYLKEEIIELDKKINYNKHKHDKLKESNKLLEEYKNKEKVLNIMLKELSPSEGLIAKSISSFLLVFTNEMNKVINSIWSYEVEILPSDVSVDDLDYKFKVKINNDEVIEDVSKLSSSLKEIVDLAFRIVFMKYMGLTDYPLYLDEFGNTFDKTHRTSAYRVIEKIISSNFTQIFLICHYESLYGSFKNADFNVLNSDNVELTNSDNINACMHIS